MEVRHFIDVDVPAVELSMVECVMTPDDGDDVVQMLLQVSLLVQIKKVLKVMKPRATE